VAVAGEKAVEFGSEFNKHFLPNCLFVGQTKAIDHIPLLENKLKPGETLIYVCKNKTCQLPVKEVKQALNQLNGH
jgi:uncharacterized protein YyaL (SSP411 family)